MLKHVGGVERFAKFLMSMAIGRLLPYAVLRALQSMVCAHGSATSEGEFCLCLWVMIEELGGGVLDLDQSRSGSCGHVVAH